MKKSIAENHDEVLRPHPWLAQRVSTRSAHATVSKVSADACLKRH